MNWNDKGADIRPVGGILLEDGDVEAWAAICNAAQTEAARKTDKSGDDFMKRGSVGKVDGNCIMQSRNGT